MNKMTDYQFDYNNTGLIGPIAFYVGVGLIGIVGATVLDETGILETKYNKRPEEYYGREIERAARRPVRQARERRKRIMPVSGFKSGAMQFQRRHRQR